SRPLCIRCESTLQGLGGRARRARGRSRIHGWSWLASSRSARRRATRSRGASDEDELALAGGFCEEQLGVEPGGLGCELDGAAGLVDGCSVAEHDGGACG